MKRLQIASLITILLHTGLNSAQADLKYSECLLNTSVNQVVSLGKPLSPQRLGNKSKIRVAVLPFYFTDGSMKELSDSDKSDYLQAASRIEDISNQKVKIDFVFLPSLNSGITSAEFKEVYLTRNVGWGERDLSKSTWGFVKRNILKKDATVNFANFDSVILEGSNQDRSFYIAEAMQFFRDSQGNNYKLANEDFFKSVLTQDGYIDNAILLDSHKGIDTLAHELLHNFGLTDLYGSGSGPGYFSMMAAGSRTLLNYEKAVLGWFPVENFKCAEYGSIVNPMKADNRVSITNVKQDSITLLKVANDKAYVFEVVNSGGKSLLLLYLLEQEMRPPITLYTNPNLSYLNVYDVLDPSTISSFYKAPDFDLLITDLQEFNLDLMLIPKNLINSSEAAAIYESSRQKKQNLITLRAAADKAAADKAAADKAAADKPAADKPAADKPAADKAKPIKKVTITCTKGKLIKKITAVKPLCPAGYKKK
jgi:hypothetical protein